MLEFDGSKLKELRKKKGMSRGDLGLLVGKAYWDIAGYENRSVGPPAGVLLTMLRHFGVKPDALSKAAQGN